MFDIDIRTIPHEQQSYETVGNWRWEEETLNNPERLLIEVSKMSDWRYEALVAFHELCEALICRYQKISQKSVDAFDIKYEKDRKKGLHHEFDEPGDDPKAPYGFAHSAATACERMLAVMLGVKWLEYAEAFEALDQDK